MEPESERLLDAPLVDGAERVRSPGQDSTAGDRYAPISLDVEAGGGTGEDSQGIALTSMGASKNVDEVAALRAQLASQQELLNEVLAGRRAAATTTAAASHSPAVPSPHAASGEGTGGGAGGGSSGAAAGSDYTDAELASVLSAQGNAPLLDDDMDLQIAREMQQMEMVLAAQEQANAASQPEEPPALEDPVWGKFVAPPSGHKPHQVLCISMCPCCVGPYCSSARKATYKKVAITASFVLSAIQLLLVIISLCFRGFAPAKVNPMLGPWPDTLNLMGAKNSALIVYKGEVWRFLTPMFLHAGFIHLLTNLVMQLRLAIFLEVKWGFKHFLGLYFASGIYSAIFSAVCIPESIGVGASGALMGIMGAWFIDIIADWGDGDRHQQQQRSFMLVMCFVNMLIILGFSMVPMIDWAAHAFGMLGGLLANMWVLRGKFEGKMHLLMKYGGSGGFILSAVLAIVLLFTTVKPDKSLEHICEQLQRQGYDISC